MSYLVLARKYRPSTFSEVVGQDHVTRTLANAFASGRVHHAFLFCGPRGCGKTTLARIVGKALNCTGGDKAREAGKDAAPRAEPCGACEACTSIGNGSAVDYQEMDGASNRGIDAIRELTEAVRYQPAVLRKKVYVIDEVHMLTTEAFNALLKTLEEPPPHVTFVLATTEPHKLPNTILSRCQRYDFKLVPASRLGQHLESILGSEQLAVEPGAISLLVRESGGSVRDALSLCDQLISYVGDGTITEQQVAEVLGVADRSLTRSLVRALAGGDAGAALGAVESAIERGVDEVQLARAIVRYLRDLSVVQVAPERPELVDATDEARAELVAEARELERSRVTQMFERMLRCCDELGKTLQPRLVLDCALIDVATVEPLVPLGDLIDRLGELEARLAGKGVVRSSGGGGGVRPPVRPAPSPKPVFDGAKPAGAAGPRTPDVDREPRPDVRRDAGAPDAAPSSSTARAPAAAPALAAPERSAPPTSSISAPTRVVAPDAAVAAAASMMAPSGPVPSAASVASGSGPNDGTPLGLPGSPAEVLTSWDLVLNKVETVNMTLRGVYEPARVLRWTREQIELGYASQFETVGEVAETKEKLDVLRRVVHETFDHAPKITIRILGDAELEASSSRSVLETSRERSSAERSKRESEAREHPITKHVLQTFGAQIKEIKTDV